MKQKNKYLLFVQHWPGFSNELSAAMISPLLFFIVMLSSYDLCAQWTGAQMTMLTNNNFEDASLPEGSDNDAAGNVHLIYLRNEVVGEEQQLIYRKRNTSGVWGDAEFPVNFLVQSASLAVNKSTGQPYIAATVIDSLSSEIYLIYFEDGWKAEQITKDTISDRSPTIALDGYGNVHIAWNQYLPSLLEYQVCYSCKISGYWQTQVLSGYHRIIATPLSNSINDYQALNTLEVTKSGAAFLLVTNTSLEQEPFAYLTNDGLGSTNWSEEIIVTDFTFHPQYANYRGVVKLADDSSVHLVISYWQIIPISNVYRSFYLSKEFDDTAFTMTDTIPDPASCPGYWSFYVLSMFLDNDGIPHAAGIYNTSPATGIHYCNASTNWQDETLIENPSGLSFMFPSLVVDAMGNGILVGTMRNSNDITQNEIFTYGQPAIATQVFPANHQGEKMLLYPNPNNGQFWIRNQDLKTGEISIHIYDQACMPRLRKEIHVKDVFSGIEVEADGLSSGHYILMIAQDNKSFSQPFMILDH